jgi:RNA polymerase sigma-70 factor (ECF subfamily)
MDAGEITGLLIKSREGDGIAHDRLTELLYPELHRIAARFMRRERSGHTLQATALVHEAYIRIMDGDSLSFKDRSHILGLAAHVMRNLLIDHARSKVAQRRGGPDRREVPLDLLQLSEENSLEDILTIHTALEALALEDPRCAKAIEGHFFGGLTIEELAAWLEVSSRTVKRDLAFAKAWLSARLVPC